MSYNDFDRVLAGVRTAAAVSTARNTRIIAEQTNAILDSMQEQAELQERQLDARKFVFALRNTLQSEPESGFCYNQCVWLETKLLNEAWQESWFATDPATYDTFRFVQNAAAEAKQAFEASHRTEVITGIRLGIHAGYMGIQESMRKALHDAYSSVIATYQERADAWVFEKYKVRPYALDGIGGFLEIASLIFPFVSGMFLWHYLDLWFGKTVLFDSFYRTWYISLPLVAAVIYIVVSTVKIAKFSSKREARLKKKAREALESVISPEDKKIHDAVTSAISNAWGALNIWKKPTIDISTQAETVKRYLGHVRGYTGRDFSLSQVAMLCEGGFVAGNLMNQSMGIEGNSLIRRRLQQLSEAMKGIE